MANVDNPQGLVYQYTKGKSKPQEAELCYVAASYGSIVGPNAPVKFAGTTQDNVLGHDQVPVVELCAEGDEIAGVVHRVDVPNGDLSSTQYIPASTGGAVWAHIGPEHVYMAQEDSVGGALASGATKGCIDIEPLAATATTVNDQTELKSSTFSAAASHPLRIEGLYQDKKNAVGTNAKWLVSINEYQLADSSVGV